MLKHIVLFSVKEGIKQLQINQLADELNKLSTMLPEIQSFSFGKNNSPEGLDQGYSYGFVMEFKNAMDRDTYLTHPLHVALVENLIIPIIKEKGGALVFDY